MIIGNRGEVASLGYTLIDYTVVKNTFGNKLNLDLCAILTLIVFYNGKTNIKLMRHSNPISPDEVS